MLTVVAKNDIGYYVIEMIYAISLRQENKEYVLDLVIVLMKKVVMLLVEDNNFYEIVNINNKMLRFLMK